MISVRFSIYIQQIQIKTYIYIYIHMYSMYVLSICNFLVHMQIYIDIDIPYYHI